MDNPKAFLLTARTYGTWLHGDERGAVDDEHNQYGTEPIPANPRWRGWEQERLAAEPLVLDDAMRAVATAAVADQCTFEGWELLACTVRTNHIHVVVEYAGVEPERMLQRIKSRITRFLRRDCGLPARQPVWTARPGSRKYLWKAAEVEAAINYVEVGQDDIPA